MSGNTFSVSSENVISRRWRSLTQKQVILGWLTSGYRTNINTLFKEKKMWTRKEEPIQRLQDLLAGSTVSRDKRAQLVHCQIKNCTVFLKRIVTEPELPRFVFSSSLPMKSDGLTTNSHIATPIQLGARKVAVVAISQLEFHIAATPIIYSDYTYW